MEIKELKYNPEKYQNKKIFALYTQFDKLLKELRIKKLPMKP